MGAEDVLLFYYPKGRYACFSNFFYCPQKFLFEFPCDFFYKDPVWCDFSEKAIMMCKAAFFGDDEMFEKIKKADSPMKAKMLGRQVKNFDDTLYEEFREYFAYIVLKSKFQSCAEMKNTLLSTGNKFLAEAAGQKDMIWGSGLHFSDPCPSIEKITGKNVQGNALMRVRAELFHEDDF